jgi:hypothetical protein
MALPINNMLYIYLLCPNSEHRKNLFQSKQSKHFHQRNQFTECEAGSNKVKLPKVGSNAIVHVPQGQGPTKEKPQQTELSSVVDTDVTCYLLALPTKARILYLDSL